MLCTQQSEHTRHTSVRHHPQMMKASVVTCPPNESQGMKHKSGNEKLEMINYNYGSLA